MAHEPPSCVPLAMHLPFAASAHCTNMNKRRAAVILVNGILQTIQSPWYAFETVHTFKLSVRTCLSILVQQGQTYCVHRTFLDSSGLLARRRLSENVDKLGCLP